MSETATVTVDEAKVEELRRLADLINWSRMDLIERGFAPDAWAYEAHRLRPGFDPSPD